MSDDFDEKVCKERHDSVTGKLRLILSLMSIFVTGTVVAIAYMVNAYDKAATAESHMTVMSIKDESHENDNEQEFKRLMVEIERAKLRADERLTAAVEKMGYEQKAMRTDITYKLDKVAEDVAELREKQKQGET